MDFGDANLAVPHRLYILNALESLADIRERGRNRSSPCNDASEEKLVCPEPCRAAVGLPYAPLDASTRPFRRLIGTTSLPADGDAGHEILDILYGKVNCGGGSGPGSPNKFFSGSPPYRASNPMIHDAHFTQKWSLPSSVALSQKSSCSSGGNTPVKSNSSVKSSCCSSSYGSKPFIRIEGFASITAELNRGVPANA